MFFADISGYTKLLLAKQFYQAFADYEYILIYQPDCLVFSDDLEYWCAKGWDYVGAPWFRDHENDPTGGLWAVGNGGLSLRNVSSALAVLRSKLLYDNSAERGRSTRYFPASPRLRKFQEGEAARSAALGRSAATEARTARTWAWMPGVLDSACPATLRTRGE